MKEKLVSKDMIRGLHPIFRGTCGDLLINLLSKVVGIGKANEVYDRSKHLSGIEFVQDLLSKLGINIVYQNQEVLNEFKEKPFITVSNHPFGHIDGIMVINAVASIRPDYKLMVNWVLMQIDTMEEFFIGVNPFPSKNKLSGVKSSVGGVKQSIEHLSQNHPLGLFPAGGISLPNLRGNVVDREWQPSTIRLIQKAQVPVIPIYVSGSNSLLYQMLGYIGWRVRTMRLLHEITNKKGKTIYIRFGEPITVQEQLKYKTTKDLGVFLQDRTYSLK